MMINRQAFKVHSLGCKVNQYDGQLLREKFRNSGCLQAQDEDAADICVINTCTVTRKADTKSRNLIRRAIKDNPGAKIIVTGCYAQDNKSILEDIKGIDAVWDNYKREQFLGETIPLNSFNAHTRAFIKIQDGCDNFCSYCKVPYVRGTPRSRKPDDILYEVKNLADNGFKEIVLCGICLGNFGRDLSREDSLVNLIEKLEQISDLRRIRLSSIEAKDVSDKLIIKMASSEKLCRHLHIPFQSGDDKILAKMNRKYTQEFYLALAEKLKNKIKDIAITTDIIVGFPGETDKNFDNTVSMLKEIVPLKVHIFPFSARKGTRAYLLKDMVPQKLIKERSNILKDISSDLSFSYRKEFLNKEAEVLAEGLKGYSSNYMSISIDGSQTHHPEERSGEGSQIIKVKIINVDKENTFAERIN